MRLPFLQLESDIISHGAAEVSHLARCSIPQALGHIAMVRAWAVSHATDEAAPDGWVPGDASGRRIEAAAHWQGENGALLQALVDAGHVRSEPGGHRVLRLEPYAKAWEQNRKSKERMRNARERSANTPVTDANGSVSEPERSAKFDGQTQTQTQSSSASQATANAAQAPRDGLPDATAFALEAQEPPSKPPKAERTPSVGEALYAELEAIRAQNCEHLGVPFVPSRWAYSRQNKDLGPIARLPAGHEEKVRFGAAWETFMDDPTARDLDEPFALSFFWKCRSRYEGRALKAMAS